MNARVIINAPNGKRDRFRVYSSSWDEYLINNKVNVEEMTGNKYTFIDTVFVLEYDISRRISAQSAIIGYKSGNAYGVAFNDLYWDRYHHIAYGLTYDEMVKRMAEGCKGLNH